MNNIDYKFSQEIIRIRNILKLTQRDFAKKLNISPSKLCNIENNLIKSPTLKYEMYFIIKDLLNDETNKYTYYEYKYISTWLKNTKIELNEYLKNISNAFRFLRCIMNMNQSEFSSLFDISCVTLYKIEIENSISDITSEKVYYQLNKMLKDDAITYNSTVYWVMEKLIDLLNPRYKAISKVENFYYDNKLKFNLYHILNLLNISCKELADLLNIDTYTLTYIKYNYEIPTDILLRLYFLFKKICKDDKYDLSIEQRRELTTISTAINLKISNTCKRWIDNI